MVSLYLKPREGIEALRYGQPDRLRVVRNCLVTMIFASVFIQRFAVYAGGTSVSLILFVNLGAIGVLSIRQQTSVHPFRAALVFLFIAYVSLCVIFDATGWTSAVFVIATYVPFAFVLRSGDALFMDCLRAYRSMVLVCAILGIMQFLLQFVISNSLLFTFKDHLPAALLMKNFNTFQPLTYGSPLHKSNGFFMIEASTFSQYVAVAVIIELLFFQVKWRLAVYGAALLFSYSGTGLIALVLTPGILISRRSYSTVVALALFASLVLATSQLWHLDVMEQRAAEINSTGSSGYGRFIAPAELIARYQLPRAHDLLFGVGPGSIRPYGLLMPYETNDPAWAKVLFEYGLVGCLLFWPMFIVALFHNSPSAWLSMALMIGFLTFGGEFLDPEFQTLLLVFCVLPKRATSSRLSMRPPMRIRQRTA